ncbi:substrate-binding domain-containing protein [Herminiimonas arsenitoxidans]|uniref:substrate-binding domain-containing protein n=1 Tax=Herminiimonas arsenitoxidans TaxID=1809410 RepID=UPI0009FA8C28|nr:PhnD/SsuA/transferrin family substrate-binding protein [Herminiimonas arsenitoxidans]
MEIVFSPDNNRATKFIGYSMFPKLLVSGFRNVSAYTLRLQRRRVLTGIAGLVTVSLVTPVNAAQPIRIGLTPVFLDERSGFLARFRDHLESVLGRPVVFVQRRSYADIVEQLLNGRLAAAWLCGYPFVRYRAQMQLIAVPVYEGTPTYHAYIITGPTSKGIKKFADLKSKVFAYSDPLSNSGFLYAQDCLNDLGQRDSTFFRKSFFAFGHQNVITAVSSGLADAGAVDGYVWDSVNELTPEATINTRILKKSEMFGFPPFVCTKNIDPVVLTSLRGALIEMNQTEAGRQLLAELRLDKFISGRPAMFDGIAAMMKRVGR